MQCANSEGGSLGHWLTNMQSAKGGWVLQQLAARRLVRLTKVCGHQVCHRQQAEGRLGRRKLLLPLGRREGRALEGGCEALQATTTREGG